MILQALTCTRDLSMHAPRAPQCMQAAREALDALPGEAAAAVAPTPRKGASGVPAASSARRPPLLALVFPGSADAEADGRAASQEALVRVVVGSGLLQVGGGPGQVLGRVELLICGCSAGVHASHSATLCSR